MEDPFVNWDTENGGVVVRPVVFLSAAPINELVGIRFEFVEGPGKMKTLQFVLTPADAEALRNRLDEALSVFASKH